MQFVKPREKEREKQRQKQNETHIHICVCVHLYFVYSSCRPTVTYMRNVYSFVGAHLQRMQFKANNT